MTDSESLIHGSSPRMRGAHLEVQVRRAGQRIIPADAGSTTEEHGAHDTIEDHPRGCGEHSCLSAMQ